MFAIKYIPCPSLNTCNLQNNIAIDDCTAAIWLLDELQQPSRVYHTITAINLLEYCEFLYAYEWRTIYHDLPILHIPYSVDRIYESFTPNAFTIAWRAWNRIAIGFLLGLGLQIYLITMLVFSLTFYTIQYNTMPYNTIQYNTIQYQCSVTNLYGTHIFRWCRSLLGLWDIRSTRKARVWYRKVEGLVVGLLLHLKLSE